MERKTSEEPLTWPGISRKLKALWMLAPRAGVLPGALCSTGEAPRGPF